MVTVTPESGDLEIDNGNKDKENEIDYDEKPSGYDSTGYDYDNLYGLIAVPILGILISVLTYLLRKYHCYRLLGFVNFLQRDVNPNDSYGSHSTATPPIILYRKDFSDYSTSQTSTYASTHYSNKEIQTSLPSIDVDYGEEENFKNSETASNLSSVLPEEDIIYINIQDSTVDQDHSTTRSGMKYK